MSFCNQIEDRLSAYHDGELEPEERERVERHLRDCARCQEELRCIQKVDERMRRLWIPDWAEPEPVVAAVRARSAAGGDGSEADATASKSPALVGAERLRGFRGRLRAWLAGSGRGRLRFAAGVAVAVTVVATVLVLYAVGRNGGTPERAPGIVAKGGPEMAPGPRTSSKRRPLAAREGDPKGARRRVVRLSTRGRPDANEPDSARAKTRGRTQPAPAAQRSPNASRGPNAAGKPGSDGAPGEGSSSAAKVRPRAGR